MVLVVIGLIVGGVLVGSDLIKAAKIRNTISQKEKFDTAANTFKLKYNCLPGDCANASQFIAGAPNGNGDGVIVESVMKEEVAVWRHLYESNLIDDLIPGINANPGCLWPGYNSPRSPITQGYDYGLLGCGNPGVGVGVLRGGWELFNTDGKPRAQEGRPGQVFPSIPFLARSYKLASGYNYQAVHAPNDLRSIDVKIDDGLPLTGNIFAVASEIRTLDQLAWTILLPPTNCVNAGVYVNSQTLSACDLVMKAGF